MYCIHIPMVSIPCRHPVIPMGGIAPAFFSRVDHPLHWLDRVRWILSCASLAALLLMLGPREFPENCGKTVAGETWVI